MNKKDMEKRVAGEKSVEFIKDGMTIGLGSGTTVYWMMQKLGERIAEGLNVRGIPTSKKTEKLAKEFGIPLVDFKDIDKIDLAIDGADEVDAEFNLIKGGGGSLVREKIIAQFANQLLIIVDREKLSKSLGNHFLPVEVTPFGWEVTAKYLAEFGCQVKLRKSENQVFISDNENYILDCYFEKMSDVKKLHEEIKMLTGVVETGFFLDMTDIVIVGKEDEPEILCRERS